MPFVRSSSLDDRSAADGPKTELTGLPGPTLFQGPDLAIGRGWIAQASRQTWMRFDLSDLASLAVVPPSTGKQLLWNRSLIAHLPNWHFEARKGMSSPSRWTGL